MSAVDQVLQKKRDGFVLSDSEIESFVYGATKGDISRAQAAAFLAFVYVNGMNAEETVALTMSMANSGVRLSWDWDGVISDKHSTGGVGDKVSLVLAPLWAALGAKVPMISGRGLGHTGGTLDKLESISGYRTDIGIEELRTIFDDIGCFISGQTSELAPADRLFYALRNEVSCVPNIPLIVASILSKKIAEGIDTLVMDVKWGSGAFMQTYEDATQLADALTQVGTGAGLSIRAVLSDMNQPLGYAVGNSLEVQEAMACLRGEGPEELGQLVCDLIGDPKAHNVLKSGAAYEIWEKMVATQGGDLSVPLRGEGCKELVITASRSGIVQKCDALKIGQASVCLGAGRVLENQPIHHGVGLILKAKVGDRVSVGQPLTRVFHVDKGVEQAKKRIDEAFVISDG